MNCVSKHKIYHLYFVVIEKQGPRTSLKHCHVC